MTSVCRRAAGLKDIHTFGEAFSVPCPNVGVGHPEYRPDSSLSSEWIPAYYRGNDAPRGRVEVRFANQNGGGEGFSPAAGLVNIQLLASKKETLKV
jgi:hypothetical protein